MNSSPKMSIPFVDLSAQYQSIKEEMDAAIQNVIDTAAFIKGPHVQSFEENYKTLFDTPNCISCANGTDAIYIALKALGIGPGDEVITVANSWISTSETITQTGAKVVFVDCNSTDFTIDTTKIEEKITPKTKAIIPVHLYGHPADMDPILALCKTYNLFCIEDCAQAHLATYKGNKVGTLGDIGTFSFFPGKNLGAYGDAGAFFCKNDDIATTARMYANHGALVKHQHHMEGINSRLDGIQAAILNVKLPHLPSWTEKRVENARYYSQKLNGIAGIECPITSEQCSHVFHLYVIKAERRDELESYLKEQGISVGRHYPTPLPLMPAYDYLKMTENDIPNATYNRDHILSLPMYPELRHDHIDYIAEKIALFYAQN